MPGKCSNTSNSLSTRRTKRSADEEMMGRSRRMRRATPAWAIADGIASQEPMDDGNNDSGVSPDHYTSNSVSPLSGLSASGRSSSLSPRSSSSQDSNSTPPNPYDYNSGGTLHSSSPLGFMQRDSAAEQQQTQQANPPPAAPGTSRTIQNNQEELQCPICAFISTSRLVFTEHLVTHCPTKSGAQKFVKSIFEQVAPLDESIQFDDMHEPGMVMPRINNQGKVKRFKCKQCPYIAVTKLEFWNHTRTHIKEGKVLTCQKCPFVTEYKHHLEYHLRNHFGSKPFQCDKCEYTCVNKSMLNSHKKSHSNVYQYGCADCSYATKYCHSLKLHLRKYVHHPAMVLNADGSPNPLPIIDVYGTRRGPKQRSPRPPRTPRRNKHGRNLSSPPHSVSSPSLSPINSMNMFNGAGSPLNSFNSLSLRPGPSNSLDAPGPSNFSPVTEHSNGFHPIAGPSNAFSPAGPSNAYHPVAGPSNAFSPVAGPSNGYHHPVAGSSNAFSPAAGPSNAYHPVAGSSNTFSPVPGPSNAYPVAGPSNGFSPAGPSNAFNPVPGPSHAFSPVPGPSNAYPVAGPSNGYPARSSNAFNVVLQNQPMMILPYSQLLAMAQLASAQSFVEEMRMHRYNRPSSMDYAGDTDDDMDVQDFPEDLVVRSNRSPFDPQPNGMSEPAFLDQDEEFPLDLSRTSTHNNIQKKSAAKSSKGKGTSRRKGKAVKLDRRVFQKDTDDEEQCLNDSGFLECPRQPQQMQRSQQSRIQKRMQGNTSPLKSVGASQGNALGSGGIEFHCPFCEIVFGDSVMFSVHMGYHGDEDPFTCKVCEEPCENSLHFFVHVATANHS
ncbi:hunchback [Nomia melanderi]|uniref:hunchback n=1 Tax=Nomia melanderi TaxID=2448451 RepID=UPI0013044985|nr:protein hunchback [Nomia melanderi]